LAATGEHREVCDEAEAAAVQEMRRRRRGLHAGCWTRPAAAATAARRVSGGEASEAGVASVYEGEKQWGPPVRPKQHPGMPPCATVAKQPPRCAPHRQNHPAKPAQGAI